jgi:hypothetical protein
MTDAFLSPQPNQCILTTHIEAVARASRETGVVDGNILSAASPADMTVLVSAGRIKISGAPLDASSGVGTITAAHLALSRIDVIYRNTSGVVAVVAGTPAVIEDPKGLGDWKSFTSPLPPAAIPPGVILGAAWVPAECTSIPSDNIWMFAGGVGDVATSIGDPGVDSMYATEKAVRDAIDTAIGASGVTNGDSHDHSGGDGAQIDHGSLAGRTDDDHSIYYNQARGDARYAQLAHASRHTSGGADAVKIDDLAAGDDNTDLNASTTKHGLMQKYPNTAQALKGDGSWLTRNFEIDFPFGDGENVIEAGAAEVGVPIASKITRADIWEVGLVSSSITCTLYKHAIGAAKGSAVDTFAISSDTDMTETGLNISVSQHEILRIEVSGITAAKQIVCRLFLEGT